MIESAPSRPSDTATEDQRLATDRQRRIKSETIKACMRVERMKRAIPNVNSGDNGGFTDGVATSNVVPATLVGYQFLVRLDDDRVKVFHVPILLLFEKQTNQTKPNKKQSYSCSLHR